MLSDIQPKIARAELNLQRKLEWVSRYDTRIIFVASIIVAMLGLLANASGLIERWTASICIAFGISFLLLGISLVFVFISQNPKILAPNRSLIFFGTIAKMKFADFSSDSKNVTEEEYLEDLLHQIHINSLIICNKFSNLRSALFCIALAIIPWGCSLYLSKIYLK